jgi:hypothetical protein
MSHIIIKAFDNSALPTISGFKMIKNGIKIFAITVLIITLSCSFKEPVLPSWFMPLSIPLSDQTFKMREIVNDSTIVARQDSLLFISIKGDLDPTAISDLYVKPQSDSTSLDIGSMELDSLKDLRTGFVSLGDLDSIYNLGLTVGDTVIIPATSLLSLSAPVESEDYKMLHVISGSVTLRFYNNLPFPVGPNSMDPNGLSLVLRNDTLSQEQIVDIMIPDTIFTGQTGEGSDQIPQNGIWIYSKLHIDFDLPISSTTQVVVTDSLLDSTGFFIEIDFENLEADTVLARLQGQHFSDKKKQEIEDENRIREGKINRGAVHIDFTSNLTVDSKIIFTLPNITDQGIPYTDSLEIQSNGTSSKDFIVDGFEVSNTSNPGEYIDSLDLDFTVLTNSQTNFVYVTSSDSISVFVQTDTLFFDYFSGFLAADTLEVSEFSEDSIADYGDFNGGIAFQEQDVVVELTLESEILIENLFFDFNVTGYHTDDSGIVTDSASLNISQMVNSNGSPDHPDIIVLPITSGVADFLNILPTSIKGVGRVSVEGEAVISQNSEVNVNYLFETPLRLQITGLDPIEGPVTTFIEEGDKTPYEGITDTLSSDVRDRGDDFQSGELQLDLINHTPLQVSIRMRISGDLSRPDSAFFVTPINDSLEFEKSATIMAGTVNPQTGFVSAARTSSTSLELTKDQIQILADPPYKVGYELTVFDSQGVVALRSTDFVKALGLAKIVVKIEDK